jgi:iron complex outermembrane receptor protein
MPGVALGLGALVAAGGVFAQRADENAVTAAQDAFGTSIGVQNVGLYSPNDARGFSPQQAGNLRIEGLFFDQQTWTISECMVREVTMRVGFAAQSYSFPAPTGIADLTLRTPGDAPIASAILARGPFDTASAELEAQIPLIERTFGVDLCASYRKNFAIDVFHQAHEANYGATFRWRSAGDTEVVPFWSYVVGGASQIIPGVYTDGTVPLPVFRDQDLAAQDWTTWNWHQTTVGALIRSTLADQWKLAAGLFHSRERDPLGYQPYLTLVTTQTADSVMDVVPPFRADSTSGELRLTRDFTHAGFAERLQFAIRGRAVDRDFGGDALLDFGTIPLLSQAAYVQPAWTFSPSSQDTTRQFDLGFTFEERWTGVGALGIGLLSDHYRRQVQVPLTAEQTDRTNPWLLNLRAEATPRRDLTLYGSFLQGLEDSALAPVSASNRNEPPPAMRTWQIDGGIRWEPAQSLQLILGAFEIHKPYFNTDAANLYTQLGQVQYRGLETSLSLTEGGLTVLIGGVYLKPRVERSIPEPGATGSVPLGPVPLTLTTSLDYAPSSWGPWAASLQFNRLSSRVATADDELHLSPLTTVGAGLRYRWKFLARPASVRLDGFNLGNAQGMHVSNLYQLQAEEGRRFSLTVTVDL